MAEAYRVKDWEEDRIQADLALNLIAATTGVSTERMRVRGRLIGRASRARRLAVYLAHVTFEWPLDRVGHAFGLNRATAAAACHWAEDARDAPAVDDLLDRLEACIRQLIGKPPLELEA